ncbi:unnamed protein product [Paramecium primaurelia]|uniref:GAF domain-containing protein n=1 Tax=Paramecium primaurelia TaxID=5886 RepID=A0A8S1KU21_PARPR|nr:unnamed protein product [Paramecium primaurelia]
MQNCIQPQISEIQTNHYFDLISVPPSMRKQSARVDQRPTQTSKMYFESDSNIDNTQSLHSLLQQKEAQLDSLQRKYLQIRQVKSRKPQGQHFMHGYLDDLINSFKDKVDNNIISEFINYSNSMNDIYRMQQTHLHLCQQRLQQADALVDQLKILKEADLFNLKKIVQSLQESLQQAQVTELDSNKLYRDLQNMKLKYAKLQNQFEIVQKQNEYTEKNMQSIKQHLQHTNEETQVYKKTLRKEASQNQFNQRRVFTLEQRLEVLSGSDYKKDKDSLRNIIEDMLKENEANKRKAFQKSQEVSKLEQAVQDFKEKNQKLQKRNLLLEKQLKLLGYSAYDLNGNTMGQKTIIESNDPDDESLDIFQQVNLPNKLDFKLNNLKLRQRNLVQDLLDCGIKQAIDQLFQMDQQHQVDQISIFMDLFVQYKNLGESVNSIFNLIKQLLKIDQIEIIMQKLSSDSQLFNCELIQLWLIDQQTATFYTYNQKNELVNAYIDTDEFLNVVKSSQPIYKQQAFVYRNINTAKFAKDCYLIPLLTDSRLIGIISLENLNNKKQDAKYLGLLISQLLLAIIDKVLQFKLINYQLRYKNLLFEAFTELSKQKSKYKLQKSIENHAETLFGVANSRFFFYSQGIIYTYKDDMHTTEYSSDIGVIGHVAKTQEALLIGNIKQHHSFHQSVDMTSGLPIFTLPLAFGVLQIVLNQSAQLQQNNKSVEVRKLLQPGETLQSMALMFTQICNFAYQLLQKELS